MILTLAGTLPSSRRPFRLAVADRAVGLHVDPADGGDPFVTVVTRSARTLAEVRDVADVALYVVEGVAW